MKPLSGSEIRQSYIQFFQDRGHTFVHSASLVPGGDSTLLFTNAGMVQFKDVFLGTDQRSYQRAVNSQKCMRVAGKHNDLDEVGRDDTHHTFFEMLGNWSFGDYYKKEAISWAWELLTNVWGIEKDKLWATYFMDDKGDVPMDSEARDAWLEQPGILSEHVVAGGRKDNFWEMAETGPCGPCSEIHIDRGPDGCNKQGELGHICRVNGDCTRYLELWNLVFIQYNRINASQLEPLPAMHVDTGMGLDRIVSILQNVNSNYRTDLLFPLLQITQKMTGHSDSERDEFITPYRVIADHARASAFLIADGVVPGNTGRNYICRMIIRRASRFGGKIGLQKPFLAKVAEGVVKIYGDAYPELEQNKATILDVLTREEKRFHRTVEAGLLQLEDFISDMKRSESKILDGNKAFDLYATHGLPLELTRDVLREIDLDVDTDGFRDSMNQHRIASGGGKAMGLMGGDDVDLYRDLVDELKEKKLIAPGGIDYDPYSRLKVEGSILAIVKDGQSVTEIQTGDSAEIVLPETCFYIESGGQVSDTGWIISEMGRFEVNSMRKPAAGMIVHGGVLESGRLRVGTKVEAIVDAQRRQDIRRNHTATHLLHAWLHKILGGHAMQAGSLVAPDRLRFDFNHPEALTPSELEAIEAGVNEDIFRDYPLTTNVKSLQDALKDGATALFGEKYGQDVRTISIGDEERISYELCGGTHVDETGDICLFIITSEGSAAAGVRRIEAITGRAAYEWVKNNQQLLRRTAGSLSSSMEEVPVRVEQLIEEQNQLKKQIYGLKQRSARSEFEEKMGDTELIHGVAIFGTALDGIDADTMRGLTDLFRSKYPSSVLLLGSVIEEKPMLICSVTEDLVKLGFHAGEFVKQAAQWIGGSGGGRPNLAQAGGKDPTKLPKAIEETISLIKQKAANK